MRTTNRNIDYLLKTVEQAIGNSDACIKAVNSMGTPKQIDAYFDMFTIAFGKHLIKLMHASPRTLEHPIEEILADYRLELSQAGDEFQVDYNVKST